MGGVCIALYGFIAVSGFKIFQTVDLNKNRNLFVASIIFITGVGGMVVSFGAVEIRTRTLTYVKGFGRPAYAAETVPAPSNPTTKVYTRTDFIKEVQKALGVKVDGVASTALLNKTVTVSTKINRRHAVVWPIQRYLNSIGYNCGNVDGDAGALFDAAVRSYQKTWTSTPDGEITKKGKTWKKMLGMA
jgi:hypothetical protein